MPYGDMDMVHVLKKLKKKKIKNAQVLGTSTWHSVRVTAVAGSSSPRFSRSPFLSRHVRHACGFGKSTAGPIR